VISTPVTLVKVGGSLLDWADLPARLTRFLEQRRREEPDSLPVLLCGGGPFADSVRRLDRIHRLGDYAAHRIAIQAMDLATVVLLCIVPGTEGVHRVESLDREWPRDEIPLLAPGAILDQLEERQPSPLPHSWDVTSDTLAAWIAGQLKATCLVLLKSASLPPNPTRDHAARLKLVDPVFPLISTAVPRVEYLNLRDAGAKPEVLP